MSKLKFLGGCREVGRNSVLLNTGNEKILMDYGIMLNNVPEGETEKPPELPQKPNLDIDGVLVSHAHIDHSGLVPSLYNRGFFGTTYATSTTFDLMQILLRDSIKIAKLKNYPQHFYRKDIRKLKNNSHRVTYGQKFPIGNTDVTVYDGGHIPGSSCFYLDTGDKTVLFTGDINSTSSELIEGMDIDFPDVDVLITETTYGERDHEPREKMEKELVGRVRNTLSENGIAMIPSFAVGRSQEMLLILQKYGIEAPIYLDGMAVDATKIILDYPEFLRYPKKLKKAYHDLRTVGSHKKRRDIVKKPCVIVTTSGMLTGGPIAYYLKKLHDRRDCSVTMTGYQVEGTNGRKLLNTGKYEVDGKRLDVKCSYKKLDFSAHSGRNELFKLINKVDPEQVFCIHGDETPKFASELQEQGYNAKAPKNGDEIEI
ncbi:MAG: MBL fold metallo-hydrolase [Candidatus Aenigmatarchaeota archaeon]